jgi:Fic family protein
MSQPYYPKPLPVAQLDYARLIGYVGRANAELARYDGLLQGLINPSVMLSPLTTQEAVLSSRIEGTQATLDEVLEHEAGNIKLGEKGNDIQEIVNYRSALIRAYEYLQERPITLSLVRQMHRLLMSSVRGQDKSPGEFRKDQNWIGKPGCTIEEATFVPPNPLQLQDHLLAWETYLSYQDFDPVVQAAIVHAQFELIHPFKDGNGRIGRLLISLFLFQAKVLSQPMFYLSAYLEDHREEYYEYLRRVSAEEDWDAWIIFFLRAVTEQAKINSTKVRAIRQLYEEMKRRVEEITHSPYALRILDGIFARPIFSTTVFFEEIEVSRTTGLPLLRKLKEANILTPVRAASGRRPGILAFSQLLNIAEGKTVL